jgi:hypothetical protein
MKRSPVDGDFFCVFPEGVKGESHSFIHPRKTPNSFNFSFMSSHCLTSVYPLDIYINPAFPIG